VIAKIQKIGSKDALSAKASYLETKILEEKGHLLEDNTCRGEDSIRVSFGKTLNLNKNIENSLAYDISLNLAHGEHYSDNEFTHLAERYLEEMGWDNAPNVIYRHTDQEHEHIHIFICGVDFEGKKLNDSLYKYRSQNRSRELEKELGLRQTVENKTVKRESLKAVNSRKYYVQRASRKALKSYSSKAEIEKLLKPEELQRLKKEDMPNDAVFAMLGEKREERLREVLTKGNYFDRLFKEELQQKLDHCLTVSPDLASFAKKVQDSGIYMRKQAVADGKGGMEFKYGLKEDNFYVRDCRLSARFRYENLVKPFAVKDLPQGEQRKEYIKKNALSCLVLSDGLESFAKQLAKQGIELVTYENKKGIYGIGYKLSGEADSTKPLNGSSMSKKLAFKGVCYQFGLNGEQNSNTDKAGTAQVQAGNVSNTEEIELKKETPHIPTVIPYIPSAPSGGRPQSGEDEPIKKKKKKKKGLDGPNMNI